MAFLGGITWKHPDYQNVTIIPLNLVGKDSFKLDLPHNMQYLASPEYADVVDAFMSFVNPIKYGRPNATETSRIAHHYNEDGNDKFENQQYQEAFRLYQCSLQLYEIIANYEPSLQDFKVPEQHVKESILLVLSNLSGTCSKLRQGDYALEYAQLCIKTDPSFVKGYLRRKEAHKTRAGATDDEEECKEILTAAMHDTMKYYELMVTDEPETRIRQYNEALKMAVVLGGTEYLPELKEADHQLFIPLIMSYITIEIQPEILPEILDYLLFKTEGSKHSGLAQLYPSDCSSISFRPFITHKILTLERLIGLRKLKFIVKDDDILLSMNNGTSIPVLYMLVAMRCDHNTSRPDDHLSDIFEYAIRLDKVPFCRFLIVEHCARPSKEACIKCIHLLRNDDKIRQQMFSQLTVEVRSEVFVHCFFRRNDTSLQELIDSGLFDYKTLDLSRMLSSSRLIRSTDYFEVFLKHGASANGTAIGVHPVTALNKSTHLLLPAKVQILLMLIQNGTDIKKLSTFYPDPMSPIHIVTKLALETGICDIVRLTCVRYSFPNNGRLIDKNNRTPLHLAMLSEDKPLSLKILKELCKYTIDKGVRDDNRKRAQDYASKQNDEERYDLVHYTGPDSDDHYYKKVKDISVDDIETFEDVVLEHNEQMRIIFSEYTGEKAPGNSLVFDISKFKVDGEYKATAFGVDGKHKDKWVEDWAKTLFPYDPDDKLTEERFLSVVQQMRNIAKDYIDNRDWHDAIYSYMRVIHQYDIWEKDFPEDDKTEGKGMIYCNMSYCLYMIKCHPDAITAADEACLLVPKYFMAHYRRGIANEQYALAGIAKGHAKCIDANGKLEKAMTEYGLVYTLLLDEEQINFRSQLICDILRIGLNRGSQEFIPNLHKFDEPLIVTKIIERLVKYKEPPMKKCAYLEVVLVKTKLHKSGFGVKYPCTFTNLSYSELLPYPSLQLLKAFIARDYKVTIKDLKSAVEIFNRDHVEHIKLLTEKFGKRKDLKQATTEICNTLFTSKKLYFVPFFLNVGAEPPPIHIIRHIPFRTLDSTIAEYIGAVCDQNFRTKVLHQCLTDGVKQHSEILINSGKIIADDINLSDCIVSAALLKKPELVEDLIKAGVSPLGTSIRTTPLSVLCSSKDVTRSQLVHIGGILITHGASIDDLKIPQEDKMSPVHVATKLVLETGDIDFLKLVCSKTSFPSNGRLIDGHNQTPLHQALRAKHNDKSIQVCQILCRHCIDPKIKDKWNKTAQDYCRSKTDKRLQYLRKAHQTMEDTSKGDSTTPPIDTTTTPPIDTTTTPPLDTATTPPLDNTTTPPIDSIVPIEENVVIEGQVEEDTSNGGKKKKKKRKRNKKKEDEEMVEEISLDPDSDPEPVIVKPPPPVKPVIQEVHTISSLLVKVMGQCDEYFVSLPSANSSFQQMPPVAMESNHDNVWIMEEIEPLVSGKHSKTRSHSKTHSNPTDPPSSSSSNIDDQSWEIECTESVLRFLKDDKCPFDIRSAAVERISSLASGKWLPSLQKPISEESGITLYEAQLTTNTYIIWGVSIQFSAKCTTKDISVPSSLTANGVSLHVFSEVIRIWDIVIGRQQKDLCIQHIIKSHDRGLDAILDYNLLPQFSHSQEKQLKHNLHNLPKKYLLKLGDSQIANASTRNPYSLIQRFCPAASIKDDEFNVFVFYQFSSDLVSCMLGGANIRRDFPFKEWPKEHDIINIPHRKETVLLVGRSGTGKTTCCLHRMWYQFCIYWEQACTRGPCYPRKPLVLCPTPSSRGTSSSSAVDNEFEHLHQIFVTKNYVLCSQMKKRFYDMAASYPHLAYHLEYENQTEPLDLSFIHNMAYPLFLTSRQFLLLLDASLDNGTPFFSRNKDKSLAVTISSSDYENHNPDTLLDIEESDDEDSTFDEEDCEDVPVIQLGKSQMPVWREVTAMYFINDIWPKISADSSNIDPLLVWIEIKSFIKGSAQAVETSKGYLSEKEYLSLGKKMASNFAGNREEMYKIFLRYENFLQKKRNLNLFDECQLVHNVYQRLITIDKEPSWSIHNYYIDEVQDFTQAELSVLIRSCREPNDLFLTGDTAQSIMRGISFRFSDLRSLFHYANERSSRAINPIKIQTPIIHDLAINFRSHSGILQLAASVIDLMKKFFPSSFDTLPEDRGMFPGPLPVFLQSCQTSDLALLLQSNKRTTSTIEFGAHQVIIVQNESAKRTIPDVLKAGIVLTVFESKGLEFDDVLLYNFFSNSSVDKDWRVVTSYADQFHPTSKSISLENKPRPLEFNEQTHKSLNSELKYLYTAVTRAKCNLWIYDSNQDRRLPIFDYWVRRGLVKVVRFGEKEEEDSILFTATSTPDQWKHQGDYFRRKGLWEPAMKCYHKANMTLLEKEAEAYLSAQKAKSTKNLHEIIAMFDNAAQAFLTCDHLCHDIKYLENAAKCLRNSKRHLEAAKLFEKLGEIELAKRSYLRAKDNTNIARIRESEGDYSGAIRVFVRANKRLHALELSQTYEKQGRVLEIDVSSFQLANQYAKFYISRRDEANLKKVLSYIDDPFVRVGHLKKGKLYQMALDEYIESGKHKDAIELILAQEMYEKGIEMATKRKEVKKAGMKLESLFQLHRATATLYYSRNTKATSNKQQQQQEQPSFNKVIELLTIVGRDSEPVSKAKARLLIGVMEEMSSLCHEAMNIYSSEPLNDIIGSIEAFNEIVKLRKTSDSPVRVIANLCFQAKELSSLLVSKSPKATQIHKLAIQFYHLSHLEDIYLLPKSQDIWIGNLHGACCIKEQPFDENGMIRLDPERVHKTLSTRFSGFVKDWTEQTALVKRLKACLSSYPFHKYLSSDQQITSFQEGFPHNLTTEYIENINICMRLSTTIPGSFDNRFLAKLVPNMFSPQFMFCVTIVRENCNIVQKCYSIQESLKSDIQYFLDDRSLFKPNVNELFDAWRCSCLVKSVVKMEQRMEAFALKRGPSSAEAPWLFVDKKGKPAYHYFFSYLLRAYSLIRESCQVIGSMKIIFNCFLAVIARRPTLRKKTSMYNLLSVVTICSTALITLLSVNDPKLTLLVPYYYSNQCKLFDGLNIQESNQFCLLTACVKQILDLKNDRMKDERTKGERLKGDRLSRLIVESSDLLCKLLSYMVGVYCDHYNVLDSIIRSKDEHVLVHSLVLLLVLLSNIRLLSDDNVSIVSESLDKIQSIIRLGIKQEVRLSSCLEDHYSQVSQLTTVYDAMVMVQVILTKFKYPTAIAKLIAAKSGNIEFKQIDLSPQLNSVKMRVTVTKEPTPAITTPTVKPTMRPLSTVEEPVTVNNPPSNNNTTTVTNSNPPSNTVTDSNGNTPSNNNNSGLIQSQVIPQPQSDAVLQSLQQQLLFILQQKHQLDQFRLLLNQQLLSLQRTPLDNLALYQQQVMQLRQQQYQATEAHKQLELQHQQINLKMLQHYNKPKPINDIIPNQMPSGLLPQATPTNMFPQQPFPPQATPNNMFPPQAMPAQMLHPQSMSTQMLQQHATPTQMRPPQAHNPVLPTQIAPHPNQASPNGLHSGDNSTNHTIVHINNNGISGMDSSLKKETDDDVIDDEMEHLLVQSQSGFFAKKDIPQSSPSSSMVSTDDSQLVDQYYCQVCGVSFKSEGTDAHSEDAHETNLASMFHTTNFETYTDHIKSKSHQDNYFSHSQFISFKLRVYSEPRKQLDSLLDDTARIESANLERIVFYIRSKLREFDQEIEEYKDSYKWRIANNRTVSFVDEMMAFSRQIMKTQAVESVKMVPVSDYGQQNLADMVFIDDEDDYGIDEIDVKIRHDPKKKNV